MNHMILYDDIVKHYKPFWTKFHRIRHDRLFAEKRFYYINSCNVLLHYIE